jgi:transposase-like protein
VSELRTEWVCSTCEVRIYKACGEEFEAPRGWDFDGDRCPACVAESVTPEEKAREMLLNGVLVNRVSRETGVARPNLEKLRAELIESGDLDPDAAPTPKTPYGVRPKDARRVAEVEAAIRAWPWVSSYRIAAELNVSPKTCTLVRKALGVPGALQARAERIAEALRENPDASDGEVAALLNVDRKAVMRARRKLTAQAAGAT